MTGTRDAAVEVAAFGGAERRGLRIARDLAESGRERREDRVEFADRLGVAADHLAVAALEAPHAARDPDIEVAQSARGEFLRAADVVDVVAVAAVDEAVARG